MKVATLLLQSMRIWQLGNKVALEQYEESKTIQTKSLMGFINL
jgi:hypothetical protein